MRMWDVVSGVAWRTLKNVFTNPSLFFPSLLFPLFFFTAFAGGLSRVSEVPGFDYPAGYTAFQFVFVFLQSAAFGGIFNGFAIARDITLRHLGAITVGDALGGGCAVTVTVPLAEAGGLRLRRTP